MGKKKPTVEINEYYMSIHLGLCHGPVDLIAGIYVGEKLAWAGEELAETDITISQPELFGGQKKDGGVRGSAYFLPGGSSQVLPDGLASRFGLTGATAPGFRGLTSLFFTGGVNGGGGFYWTANQPYIKGVWARVLRMPIGLNPVYARIGNDANPAHIIYECLTNTDWGMGAPSSMLDVPSFENAALALHAEAFGLSLMWVQQAKIEDFIAEIQDHIQATIFVNPTTGLLTIKLIRGDYDINLVPALDPNNCKVTSFQRKSWGETTNEIVVTWTNPENEQEETVALQDIANIAMQGGIVSDSRNYYGVRNSNLAMALCARDLRTASTPIATFSIEVNRKGWDLLPGEVIKLTYPEYGIENLALRINNIDYGRPGEPIIKVNASEDIFALASSAYTTPPVSEWQDTSETPLPMQYVQVITLPAYFLAQTLDNASIDAAEYPEVGAGVLAAQNSNDTFSFDLMGETVQPNGSLEYTLLGTKTLAGRWTLPAVWNQEAETLVASFPGVIGGTQPTVSGFMIIGADDETTCEIAFIKDFTLGNYVISRGVLDTTPKEWPAGTVVWFVNQTTNFADSTTWSSGDFVTYKLLTQTSLGKLSINDAPEETGSLTDRPYQPLRPANVTVGGVSFGNVDVLITDITIPVTWAERNRTLEDNQVLYWDDGTVSPEVGQTNTVVLYDESHVVLNTYPGITGTSFDLPVADFGAETTGWVQVISERDGFSSLQGHEVHISLVP